MKLHLALTDATVEQREALLESLGSVVEHVERLFPEDTGEMSRIYVITVADGTEADVIKRIRASPVCEWVEEEPKRRLIW